MVLQYVYIFFIKCFLQALSVGIFPYMLKLLQSKSRELQPVLVFIWAKILAIDGVSIFSWRNLVLWVWVTDVSSGLGEGF